MSWLHITALPKSWSSPQDFLQHSLLMLTALQGLGKLMVQVRNHQGTFEYRLQCQQGDPTVALQGAYGGLECHLSTAEWVLPQQVAHFEGTPGREDVPAAHLDRFYRALRHQEGWVYTVVAEACPDQATLALKQDVLQQLNHNHTLQKGAGSHQQGHLQDQAQQLQHELNRLQHATATGLWKATVNLHAPTASLLQSATGQLQAVLAGTHPPRKPFRQVPEKKGIHLTSLELAQMVHPPTESHPGFEVLEVTPFGLQPRPTQGLHLGNVLHHHRPTQHPVHIQTPELTGHTLVVGQTGFGKSTTVRHLLTQLSRQGIPSLVIEPAKAEYQHLPGMKVFIPGNPQRSPLQVNPFAVPEGARVSTHIDRVVSLFTAAFGMFTPLDLYLKRALVDAYEVCGWNLTRNTFQPCLGDQVFPDLALLNICCENTLFEAGYGEIGRDLRAALLGRLQALQVGMAGEVFTGGQPTPDHQIYEQPCTVELEALGDDGEKAFLMGLLLLRLLERYEAMPYGRRYHPSLRHLTVIEEAHRLLKAPTPTTDHSTADPQQKAVELFTHLLAEVRAYGEGLLIAEQIPAKLALDALKNTNLKIVHRLPAQDDRALMGGTMGLTDEQQKALTRLQVGEAVVYFSGLREATHIHIPQEAKA